MTDKELCAKCGGTPGRPGRIYAGTSPVTVRRCSGCSDCAGTPSPSTVMLEAGGSPLTRAWEADARVVHLAIRRAETAEALLKPLYARAEAERTRRERLEEAAQKVVQAGRADGGCIYCGFEEQHIRGCPVGLLRAALAAAPGEPQAGDGAFPPTVMCECGCPGSLHGTRWIEGTFHGTACELHGGHKFAHARSEEK